jgi:DHA3 family macrolide efflux protein-like MFS transporter
MNNWKLRFCSIWTGQMLSSLGSAVARFALIWWVTESTGSATVLASATTLSFLPGILLSPFAGVLADRHSRRLIMIVSDAFIALVSLWLAYLFWTETMQVWHVYVVIVARAVGNAFYGPASGASFTMLVPKEQYGRLAGLNLTRTGVLEVAGPALGALAIAWFPLHQVMLLDGVTAAFAIAPLLIFAIPQPEPDLSSEGKRSSYWHDFLEGFRYIIGWRALLLFVGLAAIVNFMLASTTFMVPMLVYQGFSGDATMLGWFESIFGVGMIGGGLLLSLWGGARRKILVVLGGFVCMGGILLIPAWTPTPLWPIAAGGFGLLGLVYAIAQGSMTAAMRGLVAPSKQGRFYALFGSLMTGSVPIGLMIAGVVADAVSMRFWYTLGGITLILAGSAGYIFPALRRIEEEAREAQEASSA